MKDISDEELEKEMEKALKADEAKKDHCGTAIPSSKEVGIQRTDVKLKKDKFRWNYVEDKKYPCNDTKTQFISRLKKNSLVYFFFF